MTVKQGCSITFPLRVGPPTGLHSGSNAVVLMGIEGCTVSGYKDFGAGCALPIVSIELPFRGYRLL